MMENLLPIAFVAALVGAIAGFLAGKVGQPRFVGPPRFSRETEEATIFIYDSPAGFTAKVVPSVIPASKNVKIEWTIADLTPLAPGDVVDLEWVTHPASTPDIGKNPLQSLDREMKRLKGKIKEGAKKGDKFRYVVRLNTKTLVDPDVEIVF